MDSLFARIWCPNKGRNSNFPSTTFMQFSRRNRCIFFLPSFFLHKTHTHPKITWHNQSLSVGCVLIWICCDQCRSAGDAFSLIDWARKKKKWETKNKIAFALGRWYSNNNNEKLIAWGIRNVNSCALTPSDLFSFPTKHNSIQQKTNELQILNDCEFILTFCSIWDALTLPLLFLQWTVPDYIACGYSLSAQSSHWRIHRGREKNDNSSEFIQFLSVVLASIQ